MRRPETAGHTIPYIPPPPPRGGGGLEMGLNDPPNNKPSPHAVAVYPMRAEHRTCAEPTIPHDGPYSPA